MQVEKLEVAVKVLLAVDGLKTGGAMAAFIASHTWPQKTIFRVLHAIEPTKCTSADRALIAIERRQRADILISKVRQSILERCAGAKIETKISVGQPREVVLAMVDRWHADLVMVGSTHKKSKNLPDVLNSVSTAIAFQCSCSVLIVRGKASRVKPSVRKKSLMAHEERGRTKRSGAS